MMDIKLIYSFILLGTSSALAPGRNPLRHLAAEKGPVTSPAPLPLPAAAAEVATELSGVSAEDIKTVQNNVEESVSNMEEQIVAVVKELEQLPSSLDVDEVVEVVKDVASQIEEVTASDLAGSFSTEDATNATALLTGGPSLDPACFNPKSDKFDGLICKGERLVVRKAIQKEIAAIKTAIVTALTSLAKKLVAIKVDAFKDFVGDVISTILLVKAKIELVLGLLTKLKTSGIEDADTTAMLKEVKAMEEVMDETYDTMIEVKEVDDTSLMAEPLASLLGSLTELMEKMPGVESMDLQEFALTKVASFQGFLGDFNMTSLEEVGGEELASLLEYLAALMEEMPGVENMDLQEVAMTEVASSEILLGDFKTFVLHLKNVIRTCLLKHGGSTTSHKSKASKASYKSKKESWREECLEALKGYKLSSALLGLDDHTVMMADTIGLDLAAMEMESVAPEDQDQDTTISVSKFQAYDSSGMHKSFPAAISSILVASAFVLLF